MYGRVSWGGPLEIEATDSATNDDRSRNSNDLERAPLRRPLNKMEQSWLRRPTEQKKKKNVHLVSKILSRKIFVWTLATIVASALLAGFITLIVKTVPRNHHKNPPLPDNYSLALHKALNFFNAQKSGKLSKHNNVSWRGNSGLQDGIGDAGINRDLSGGFYTDGENSKVIFPMAYSMTLLSWSLVEYGATYEASGELVHVKELLIWGSSFLLKTFSADGLVSKIVDTDSCWMRPEQMDYRRYVDMCNRDCSELAAEIAAALASASIVFKDNGEYSTKLRESAKTIYQFAIDTQSSAKSTKHWDEIVWSGTWLYYATGNVTYLDLITKPTMAKLAGAFSGGPLYGVFSWENKLAGVQLLLTRLRLFLGPGYPYEEILSTFHNHINIVMCSYLPYFTKFNRTRGGLIELNHGDPQPLQYAANAAFLATLYSDYLDAADTPGWNCGPNFYTNNVLREFARTQVDYILGKNPLNMSYLVGFGPKYPTHVHHMGASVPHNNVKYNCTQGLKWRDSKEPNPNMIEGAMVGGPDKRDGFRDVRDNYNYTEPTLAGNAGLVAALVALSGGSRGVDKNNIFAAIPPLFAAEPPPPAPWTP